MGIKFCPHDKLKNACNECLRDELAQERKRVAFLRSRYTDWPVERIDRHIARGNTDGGAARAGW